jgi:hypothetical protein
MFSEKKKKVLNSQATPFLEFKKKLLLFDLVGIKNGDFRSLEKNTVGGRQSVVGGRRSVVGG